MSKITRVKNKHPNLLNFKRNLHVPSRCHKNSDDSKYAISSLNTRLMDTTFFQTVETMLDRSRRVSAEPLAK